jgi:hypothetical protein
MTKSGSEIYAAFVEAELKAENDRRDSVNRRAATALTGSTALITLALAIIGWRQHLVSVSTLNRMLGSHRSDSEVAARDCSGLLQRGVACVG